MGAGDEHILAACLDKRACARGKVGRSTQTVDEWGQEQTTYSDFGTRVEVSEPVGSLTVAFKRSP